MKRTQFLNLIIAKKEVKNYLEIGVNKGRCLFNIKGPDKKWAVDPKFSFSTLSKFKAYLKNSSNFKNKYFEITSDDFFEQNKSLLEKNPIDLAFIDGLHTYAQSYKDVVNTMKYLSKDGVVVLHDCNPLNKFAAIAANTWDEALQHFDEHPETTNKNWNGDVWKTILHIRKFNPEWTAFVLNTDHGLGIVLPRPETKKFEMNLNTDIKNLEYEFLESNREEILNLKSLEKVDEILNSL